MPILITIIGLLTAAGIWFYRIRAAKDVAGEMFDMANDVRLAAKRFAYKRNNSTHPIDGIDDARLAAAGIMAIAAEMDGAITANEQRVMRDQAVNTFDCSTEDAEEFVIFGHWLASQGTNRHETTRRLIKRTISLGGMETLPDLIKMVTAVGTADGAMNDEGLTELIEQLKRAQVTGR